MWKDHLWLSLLVVRRNQIQTLQARLPIHQNPYRLTAHQTTDHLFVSLVEIRPTRGLDPQELHGAIHELQHDIHDVLGVQTMRILSL